MKPRRLALLRTLGALAMLRAGSVAAQSTPPVATAPADPVRRGRPIVLPRDNGAHLGRRIEWWYATGWLRADGAPADDDASLIGFQLTFFRSRTGLAADTPGRFAARQLLFAHAAVTDLAGRRHLHADRLARWAGDEVPTRRARASTADTDVRLDGWQFSRTPGPAAPVGTPYTTTIDAERFAFTLRLAPTQPVLLQGDEGFSRKGPAEAQASHYLSEPQLDAAGNLRLERNTRAVRGRAWLDHEWSDELLHPEAVGWDWIGMNLDDGRALTAFRLRRADGAVLWAGGSLRLPGGAVRAFGPGEVTFTPGRPWRSPASNASYPVEWQLQTPAGRHTVRALMDTQELDSRASTGAVYWEGLSALQDAGGRRVGLGYLEMTGYVSALRF